MNCCEICKWICDSHLHNIFLKYRITWSVSCSKETQHISYNQYFCVGCFFSCLTNKYWPDDLVINGIWNKCNENWNEVFIRLSKGCYLCDHLSSSCHQLFNLSNTWCMAQQWQNIGPMLISQAGKKHPILLAAENPRIIQYLCRKEYLPM